ncbi:TPA: chorismate synthase [Candidatus Bathyarchaeota archaeon]|nr:chorismate synthase [Candidatus Bathyarchaeota archaeon]
MPGSKFGVEFSITCFGESHGKCVGVILEGCPAGLKISKEEIQGELNKRIPKDEAVVSPRIEKDEVEILSGVFQGSSTGAPICMIVNNKDVSSEFYEEIKFKPRPGHADYPAWIKYGGFNDYRGGGIFSGRMTVPLIMAGAVAKKLLGKFRIEVLAHAVEVAGIKAPENLPMEAIKEVPYTNSMRCADLKAAELMRKAVVKAAREGDSVGGMIEGIALNVPPGIGEPLFDALDCDLAKILFAIPGVKGVEFGVGFEAAKLRGSANNDEYVIVNGQIRTLTNNSGGILGGLSTGMPIVTRVAFKPPSSIKKKQRTVNLKTMQEDWIEVKGRHDPCIVPKAVPTVEACIAVVLCDHLIRAGVIPRVLK